MSRKGNGWDNAGIESGHHVLTQALIFGRRFQTRVQSQAEPTRLRGDRVAVASFVPRSIMPGPLCAGRARPRPGHARLDRWSVATCLADGCGSQGIEVQHSPGRPDRRARGRGVSYNSVCKLGVDVGSRGVGMMGVKPRGRAPREELRHAWRILGASVRVLRCVAGGGWRRPFSWSDPRSAPLWCVTGPRLRKAPA